MRRRPGELRDTCNSSQTARDGRQRPAGADELAELRDGRPCSGDLYGQVAPIFVIRYTYPEGTPEGAFEPATNTIFLEEEKYENLRDGSIDERAEITLLEEAFHAAQYDRKLEAFLGAKVNAKTAQHELALSKHLLETMTKSKIVQRNIEEEFEAKEFAAKARFRRQRRSLGLKPDPQAVAEDAKAFVGRAMNDATMQQYRSTYEDNYEKDFEALSPTNQRRVTVFNAKSAVADPVQMVQTLQRSLSLIKPSPVH